MKGPEKAKLHDLEVDAYLAECVTIYPEAVSEEMTRVPSDLAYWGERFAVALRAYLTAKLDEKRTHARVRILVREGLAQQGKVTEGMVDAATDAHPEVEKASLDTIEAEVEKVRLYGVVDAIRSKRDMLQSIGAQVRAEMQHDPMTRKMVEEGRLAGK
jgi:hypothetical protein